jgi:hypothetical protein
MEVALAAVGGSVEKRCSNSVCRLLRGILRIWLRKAGSYFGWDPCQDASADKNRLGHITRDGPATVRKLMVEAAWQGVRRSPTIKAFYDRVTRNDPDRKKIAIVATAHYMTRVAVSMLKNGEVWREDPRVSAGENESSGRPS